MSGRVQLFGTSVVPGPYTQQARADWLRKLLRAQIESRSNAPEDLKNIELITLEELREIRRTWVVDKHEIEDLLPRIYFEETGFEFPDDTNYFVINRQSEEILKEVCGDDSLHYEMVRNLMATSRTLARQAKRRNLMKSLEDEIKRSYYEGKEDALELARTKATMLGQPADWIVEDVEAESEEASVVEVSVNPRGASK
jgi:DNA sulfur modification protein DndC